MRSPITPNMTASLTYIKQLELDEYIGAHDPRDVLVLTDSGYDDKKIENAIINKQLEFHYCCRENPQCEIGNRLSDDTEVTRLVSHCHVLSQSS